MKQCARYRGITLKEAQRHLDEWMEAELEVTTHQSYHLGNQTLTMADLDKIGDRIDYWRGAVAELEAAQAAGGRNRAYRAVPRDW